jgi:hypothetical protein
MTVETDKSPSVPGQSVDRLAPTSSVEGASSERFRRTRLVSCLVLSAELFRKSVFSILVISPRFDFSNSRNPRQRWVSAIFSGYRVAM